MKARFYILISVIFSMLVVLSACEKNDPIGELGTTNNEFAAQLRVNFNNSSPKIGDSVTVTASLWQRDDKISNVRFYETVVESFGLNLKLKKQTQVLTAEEAVSTLLITDTIFNKKIFKEVIADTIDYFYVTSSHNYVIAQKYFFVKRVGDFPETADLILKLDDDSFDILKGILAYKLTTDDYLDMFPEAPATHYTASGLTLAGRTALRELLTKETLAAQVSEITKTGTVNVTLDVDVLTPTGTVTSGTRTYTIEF